MRDLPLAAWRVGNRYLEDSVSRARARVREDASFENIARLAMAEARATAHYKRFPAHIQGWAA